KIDEAALTGESVPVDKGTAAVDPRADLAERLSMAYSGTLVAAGQGLGVVTATGASTELGRIGGLLQAVETLETPLIRRMNAFARQITFMILAVSAATFLFAMFVRAYALGDALMTVVGLAVAAIPEGLPAVMTITLAIGVQRMARRDAIIRRLPAVETLGAVSVICTDKTGTLTRNEMTACTLAIGDRRIEVDGVGYAPEGTLTLDGKVIGPGEDPALAALIRAGLLCNDASLRSNDGRWLVDGDPMEGALVTLALKAGLEPSSERHSRPRLDTIPFDARYRYMATLHRVGTDGEILVKGAPERVLEMCSSACHREGDQPIDANAWHQVAEARAAVTNCRAAGIRVAMITGDHAATARAIAGQLGLAEDPVVRTGRELDALDDAALRPMAQQTEVFARTTPEHKLRLVNALLAVGLTVAMTGDGVNDAPALKRADVGVAMGQKGTEAAKEAAEMVLADDNFASIVAAVREGRTVYDNLMKVIAWTLPTNGGEAMTILAAISLGLALPITPVQILWINMITAVTLGLTLAFEPTEPGTMARQPLPPDQSILSGALLWRVVFVSLLFVLAAFGMFYWAEARGLPLETARTLVVNTIVVMEIAYLFSIRYVHSSALTWQGVLGTPPVLIGVTVVVLGQVAFTYLPAMHLVFDSRPVAVLDGLAVMCVGVALLVIVEFEKTLRRRFASV
ncbi:MAG: HAD-IC family P-type ATPase, partial [Pseudomonadota bacterium]